MGFKDKSNFKVVIAGGSITGLTLANMLQLYGIDFVILEAWHEMTPQVGASIGMLPHGNRILDQLGLYEKVLELCPPLDSMHFRDHTGKIIHEFKGMNGSMHERHGYPITFLDRQMVLKVLYENVKDKSKVLSSKRVNKVEMTDSGVIVKTVDGSTYEGDILIGGDGIHSTVRSEMWRIANLELPGWIPDNEKQSVPCDFGCVFGISNPCQGIEPGAFNSIFRKHQSYIVIGGPKGRVYWFFFFKLPARLHGDDIPKYSEQDHDQVLKEAENNNITPSLKFRDLLNRKISSVLVPLQEYVFRQWHYKRIITIGDSAHKVNIHFRSQRAVATRMTMLNDRIDAPYYWSWRQCLHRISRHLAERLDNPKPKRQAKLVPYKDELLSTPTPRGVKKWLWVGFYLAVAALVHYGMWVWSAHYELGPHLISIIELGSFDSHPKFELQRRFTGIDPIDDYLQFLTAIFIPGINEWDLNYGTLSRNNTKIAPRKVNKAFEDLPYLKFLYGAMASIGVLQHVYILAKIWFSTEMTLSSVFWPDFSPEPKELGEGLRQLFLADFWGFHIGTYGWLCMAVWDIKRVGRTNVHIGKAITLITLGSLVIGPGATMCLVWYWRECAMAKTTFALDHIPSSHGK
uniref:FAD-binding domain-containing protein n=1 Tax=Bionectria ochroleuca TaxID=29856 RepID=A0A0B7KJ93_BIOOC